MSRLAAPFSPSARTFPDKTSSLIFVMTIFLRCQPGWTAWASSSAADGCEWGGGRARPVSRRRLGQPAAAVLGFTARGEVGLLARLSTSRPTALVDSPAPAGPLDCRRRTCLDLLCEAAWGRPPAHPPGRACEMLDAAWRPKFDVCNRARLGAVVRSGSCRCPGGVPGRESRGRRGPTTADGRRSVRRRGLVRGGHSAAPRAASAARR